MNNDLDLSHRFCEKHPSDAASILVRLPVEYVAGFISSLPPAQGINLVHHMPTAYTTQLLPCFDEDYGARLLAHADFSTAARLLRPLPARQRGQLMAQMDGELTGQLTRIFTYPPDSVGNLVEIPLMTGLGDWNVKHALRELKKIHGRPLYDFPVVDDEHRFLGMVAVHTLLNARDSRRLDELCSARVPALPAHATIASVLHHPAWEINLAIPVIDSEGMLLGLLHRTTLNTHMSGTSSTQTRELLAPALTIAELYWAASSSIIAMLGKEPPHNKVE